MIADRFIHFSPTTCTTPTQEYTTTIQTIHAPYRYICAPITSPAGLPSSLTTLEEIKAANRADALAALELLCAHGFLQNTQLLFPAEVGSRYTPDGKPWGETQYNTLMLAMMMGLPIQYMDSFENNLQLTADQAHSMNNYKMTFEERKAFYQLFADKAISFVQEIGRDVLHPPLTVALPRYVHSLGCWLEDTVAQELGLPFEVAQLDPVGVTKRVRT